MKRQRREEAAKLRRSVKHRLHLRQQQHQRDVIAQAKHSQKPSTPRSTPLGTGAAAPKPFHLSLKQQQEVAALVGANPTANSWAQAAVRVGLPGEYGDFVRASHTLWARQRRVARQVEEVGIVAEEEAAEEGDDFTVDEIDFLLLSPTKSKRLSRRMNAGAIDYSKLDHSDKDNVYKSAARDGESAAASVAEMPARAPEAAMFRPLMRGTFNVDENGVAHWIGYWGESESEFEREDGFVSAFSYEGLPQPGTVDNLVGVPDYLMSGYFVLGDRSGKREGLKQTERKVLLRFVDEPEKGSERSLGVIGQGKNKFGTFSLTGSYDIETQFLFCYREYSKLAAAWR